jgi:hypothetical protein
MSEFIVGGLHKKIGLAYQGGYSMGGRYPKGIKHAPNVTALEHAHERKQEIKMIRDEVKDEAKGMNKKELHHMVDELLSDAHISELRKVYTLLNVDRQKKETKMSGKGLNYVNRRVNFIPE